MSKWTKSRAGILSYWNYDFQEFIFRDGNLLFYGPNGTGKSVTMQSLITPLLDGQTRSERLDPNPKSNKKIEDYILGYGADKKENNVSYLFLEFKKDTEPDQFITIGIGLNASVGRKSGVKFLGFVIKGPIRIFSAQHAIEGNLHIFRDETFSDGRRAYKPLALDDLEDSLKKLKGVLHEVGDIRWTYERGQYASFVNEVLFGYPTMEDFNNLIQVLISIRAPRFGNEDRGKEMEKVNETLSDSLSPLPDAHFEELADILSTLDNRVEQLGELKQECNMLDDLTETYQKYTNIVLSKGLEIYRGFEQEHNKMRKDLQNKRNEEERIKSKEVFYNNELVDKEKKNNTTKGKLGVLQSSPERQKVDELVNVQTDVANAKEDLVKRRQDCDKYKKTVDEKSSALEVAQKQDKNLLDSIALSLKDAKAEIVSNNLWFVTSPTINSSYVNIQSHLKQCEMIKSDIHKIHIHVLEIRKVEEEKSEVGQSLDNLTEEYQKVYRLTNQLSNKLDDGRKSWFTDFNNWEAMAIKAIEFTSEDAEKVARCMSRLYHSTTIADITELNDDLYREAEKVVQNRKSVFQYKNASLQQKYAIELEDYIKKQQELVLKLEKVEAQKNIPIEVHLAISETHKWLTEVDIPHAFFYDLIDFLPDLSVVEQAKLENGLLQAGLLDAVYVPFEFHELIPEDKPIKLLAPAMSKQIHTVPLCLSLPAVMQDYKKEILNILNGIGLDTNSSIVSISANSYKNGMIFGSCWDESAQFIGAEARRQKWHETVRQLKKQIDEYEEQIQVVKGVIKATEEQRQTADDVVGVFPNIYDLSNIFKEYKENCIKHLELIKKQDDLRLQLHTLTDEMKGANDTFDREWPAWNRLFRNEFAGSWKRSIEYIASLPEIFSRYCEFIKGVADDLQEKRQLADMITIIDNNLKEVKGSLENAQEYYDNAQDKYSTLFGKEQELRRIIEEEGLIDFAQRIKVLEKDVSDNEERIKVLDREIGKLVGKLTEIEPAIQEMVEKCLHYQALVQVCQSAFEDVLSLYHPDLTFEDVNASDTRLAAAMLVQNDDNMRDIGDRLTQKYFNYTNLFGANSLRMEKPPMFHAVGNVAPEFLVSQYNIMEMHFSIPLYIYGRSRIHGAVNPTRFTEEKHISWQELNNIIHKEQEDAIDKACAEGMEEEIQSKIFQAEAWTTEINNRFSEFKASTRNTKFRLKWVPDERVNADYEIAFSDIADLIRRHIMLAEIDYEKVKKFYLYKLNVVREAVKEKGSNKTYREALIEAFDYRKWFRFQIEYNSDNTSGKWEKLTQNAYNTLSGGEKAMAIYQPLYVAVSSRYDNAKHKDCPRFIVMDEAFTVVDYNNINESFRLLTELDINYIINSQNLHGAYPAIQGLSIYQYAATQSKNVVSLYHYEWDGQKQVYPEVVRNNGR